MLFESSEEAWIDEEAFNKQEDAMNSKVKKGRKKRTEEGLPVQPIANKFASDHYLFYS